MIHSPPLRPSEIHSSLLRPAALGTDGSLMQCGRECSVRRRKSAGPLSRTPQRRAAAWPLRACRTQVKSAENHFGYRERRSHDTQNRLAHSSTRRLLQLRTTSQVWFGTLPPWLAQGLYTSRRRGTRLPSVVSPSETAGVLHSTSSRVGRLDCWGSPVITSEPHTPRRAAQTS